MMITRALVLATLAAAAAAGVASATPRFAASAQLEPTGCKTAVSGTKVSVTGCAAKGALAGSHRGALTIRYAATVDLGRGRGSQRGTAVLTGAAPGDRLVLRFRGTVSVATGGSRGRWTATARRGAFARTAPKSGTYTSRTPDQGVHVTFRVSG